MPVTGGDTGPRLCYISAARPSSGTAHSLYVYRLGQAFAALQVGFRVVAPGAWSSAMHAGDYSAYGGVSPVPLQLMRSYPPIRTRYHVMASRLLLGGLSLAEDEVAVTHNMLFAVSLAVRGYPFALDLHGETKSAIGKVLLHWIATRPHCVRVFAISESHRNVLLAARVPAAKIAVVRNGVDLVGFGAEKVEARAELGIRSPGPLVVYAGSLSDDRGFDIFFPALAQLPADVNCLIVGGSGPEIERCRTLADRAGVLPRVSFIGKVHASAVPEYLAAADVLVALYTRRVGTHRVMSPLKIYEYMAARRPIVAPMLPTIAELLEHKATAFLHTPESPHHLAAGIRWIIEQPAEAEEIASRAATAVRRYSWEARARKIAEQVFQWAV